MFERHHPFDHLLSAGLKCERTEINSQLSSIELASNLNRRLCHPHFIGRLAILAIIFRGELSVSNDDLGDCRWVLGVNEEPTPRSPFGDRSLVGITAGSRIVLT